MSHATNPSNVTSIVATVGGAERACPELAKLCPELTLRKRAQHRFAPDYTSALMAPYLNMSHFLEPLTLDGLNWI